jgi:hypothetical protein
MTPTGIETLLVLIAFYTLTFLWVILPEPDWATADVSSRDR